MTNYYLTINPKTMAVMMQPKRTKPRVKKTPEEKERDRIISKLKSVPWSITSNGLRVYYPELASEYKLCQEELKHLENDTLVRADLAGEFFFDSKKYKTRQKNYTFFQRQQILREQGFVSGRFHLKNPLQLVQGYKDEDYDEPKNNQFIKTGTVWSMFDHQEPKLSAVKDFLVNGGTIMIYGELMEPMGKLVEILDNVYGIEAVKGEYNKITRLQRYSYTLDKVIRMIHTEDFLSSFPEEE